MNVEKKLIEQVWTDSFSVTRYFLYFIKGVQNLLLSQLHNFTISTFML